MRDDKAEEQSPTDARRYRRNLALAAAPTLAVPAVLAYGLRRVGAPLSWPAVGIGAGGWTIALALRGPVALLAGRVVGEQRRAQPWIVASSGPLEEGARLLALRLAGRDFPSAASLGLGWATVEVLYSLGTGVAIAALLGRTDPEAQQARALIAAQGMGVTLEAGAPLWGIAERLSASALHLGFTLLLARRPAFVPVTALAHSAANLVIVRLVRRSPALAQAAVGLAGAAALAAGLGLARPRGR